MGAPGLTQDKRTEKWLKAVSEGNFPKVKALVGVGVDVNATFPGGVTAIELMRWRGDSEGIAFLKSTGECNLAKLNDCGVTWNPSPSSLASLSESLPASLSPSVRWISGVAEACTIDSAVSPELRSYLLAQVSSLPPAPQKVKKNQTCSTRYYYPDYSGCVSTLLSDSISSAYGRPASVLRGLRLLNYSVPGGSLPAHVDLPKFCPCTFRSSTHTLLLYLTSYDEGRTALLESERADSKALEEVQVVEDRLLCFRHDTPHEGRRVEGPGKIIVRGEFYFT